ncbi:MAG: glycosyltransferase family 4 protein [Deltaproteobacteria bacterium]|nr:glycosyltransferase family 4 protein [Deltaproteobacteria bacterium]
MNIGLIRMRYTPYGGAEVFLSRFIDELIKKGHTCHVFAAEWGHDDSRFKIQDSKRVFHKIKTFGPSFLRLLSFAINSCFAVRKANLDIILGFDRTLEQDIYRAGDGCHREWLIQRILAEARSRKQEVGKQNILPLKKLITYINPLHLTILFLEKRLFKSKKLKFVVANSKRGKDEIIRHYNLPEEKICVIYNGIDIKAFNLDDRDNLRSVYREKLGMRDEIIFLFVGSGFERKGLRFLIEAIGVLKKESRVGYAHQEIHRQNGGQSPPCKLVVVGKGNITKYQTIADNCGMGMDVQFVGPASDVKGYYCAADVFVLPSVYEPFSNACLEAMASELPVVTSRINGVSEILTSGKDGMIVDDPSNPEEIAEKIEPLLHEETRLAIGKAARKTVENYTIEKNVNEFLRFIEGMK